MSGVICRWCQVELTPAVRDAHEPSCLVELNDRVRIRCQRLDQIIGQQRLKRRLP